MEASQVKRTVKTKFLIANKCGRGVKSAGPYALAAGLFLLKTAIDSYSKNDEDDDNSDKD